MRFAETNGPQVVTDYFGLKVLTDGKGWLAVDADGSLYSHETEPYAENECSEWITGTDSNWAWVGRVDLEGMDWRDTLMEIKQPEPGFDVSKYGKSTNNTGKE